MRPRNLSRGYVNSLCAKCLAIHGPLSCACDAPARLGFPCRVLREVGDWFDASGVSMAFTTFKRGCFAILLYEEHDFDDSEAYLRENRIAMHLQAS
jgi:hypothetical protein